MHKFVKMNTINPANVHTNTCNFLYKSICQTPISTKNITSLTFKITNYYADHQTN